MSRIAVLSHPKSQYDVLHTMAHDYFMALRGLQNHVDFIETKGKSGEEILHEIVKLRPDYTFAINLFIGEESLFIPHGIPQVHLNVDILTHAPETTLDRSGEVLLFIDKDSSALVQDTYKKNALWFPHGISKKMLEACKKIPYIPLTDRPYEVSFIGSFQNPKDSLLLLKNFLSKENCDRILSLVHLLLEDDAFPFLQTVLHEIQSFNVCNNVLEEWNLMNLIETYARNLDRMNLIKALSEHTIHVFSSQESAQELQKSFDTSNCVFHKNIPFSEVPRICCQSTAIINSHPTLRLSLHERFLLSLASGALILTKKNPGIPKASSIFPQVIPYSQSTLQFLSENIEKRKRMIVDKDSALSYLEAEHSYEKRLSDFLPEIEKRVHVMQESYASNPFYQLLDATPAETKNCTLLSEQTEEQLDV